MSLGLSPVWRRAVGLATMASAGVIAACSLVVDTSGLAGVAAGSADAAIADAAIADAPADGSTAAVDAAGACPGTHGPTPIRVGTFCIDSTEVTTTQYAEFVQAKAGDMSGQPSTCGWNTTFVPGAPWPPAANEGNRPVTGVDWCDAHAFCEWAGKRMCGAIAGSPLAYLEGADPSRSQWVSACSKAGDGAHKYPYGNTYVVTTCNGLELGLGKAVDVASMSGCEGGYAGLFDMSGNVSEWEDACILVATGPTRDKCAVRGGSFGHVQSDLACGAFNYFERNTLSTHAGIRCCSP